MNNKLHGREVKHPIKPILELEIFSSSQIITMLGQEHHLFIPSLSNDFLHPLGQSNYTAISTLKSSLSQPVCEGANKANHRQGKDHKAKEKGLKFINC